MGWPGLTPPQFFRRNNKLDGLKLLLSSCFSSFISVESSREKVKE